MRTYTYNNAGHLGMVAGAGYSYNARRLRSRKIGGAQGTVYHYDLMGNLIAETDTAGVLRRAYVWAEGQPLAQVEAVTTLPPDIIVDNTQATFTGTWPTATSLAGFYGANYRTNTKGTGKDKATWTVNVPTTGTYQVYARWVAASTHASNAPFTVKHSTGSQTLAVNQRTSGGQWYLLGSYAFSAGTAGSVTLTDQANGTVIADAVKLVATSGGTTSEVVRYLHTDHLNTLRLATNAGGVKIWSWEGSAFGNTPPNEDPDGDGVNTVINLRFAGQYYDSETGLHYNWNRYYDPKVGRYITSDPIGLAGGLNTYAYVGNNPLRFIDPRGLASLDTDMGGGTTTFDPRPEDPNGVPTTIPTRTQPDSTSLPGAGDPISTPDVNCIMNYSSEATGPAGTYISVGDPRNRDIHGGGTGVPGARGPRQSHLSPTKGCTRGYNDDLRRLCDLINDFKSRHPGVPIPHTRRR